LIHVSFPRQIDTSSVAAMLLNLAQFCSNYGVEYTKAVYKILPSLGTGKNRTPTGHLIGQRLPNFIGQIASFLFGRVFVRSKLDE